MVRQVYADNRQYRNVEELKRAILDAWNSISTELLKKLSDSIQNRIFQVIQRNGGLLNVVFCSLLLLFNKVRL